MKAKDTEEVLQCIDNEGFDYCFRHYSNFEGIKDKEFHKLREGYVNAANELAEYLGTD